MFSRPDGRRFHHSEPGGFSLQLHRLAAGDTTRWWWPADPRTGAHWPAGAVREVSLPAFCEVFAQLGYEACASDALEPGYEKVALFAREGRPTHAARQLASGLWTSKLGHEQDIEHPLNALAADTVYGSIVQILRRPRPT